MDKKILLVDDDPSLQELIQMSLELGGFEVVVAADGKHAMNEIEAGTFDLIILDLMMPVMDGVCFVRWLRGEKQDATPVLVMSGAVQQGMVEELKSIGVTAVVSKPIDIRGFLLQVNRLL